MDLRAQYLQAMRDQAPALFKRLSERGQLEKETRLALIEAECMFRDLMKDAKTDKSGQPTLQARREVEEQVRAALLNFAAEDTSLEEDERDYLLVADRPLLSPGGST
jgi:hypothetical protein